MDEILQDREDRPVVRRGNTVRHPVHPWSSAIRSLLHHLHAVGFSAAPRHLGQDGDCDVLSYIDGESGPSGWAKIVPDEGLVAFARLLREYHDAVAGWRPAVPPTWYDGRSEPAPGEIVCHGDFGPWNVVWRGTTPVGLIDWEYARLAPPSYDVWYALQYAAPFRPDAECVRWLGYPDPPDRRRRTETFLDAYGWTTPEDVVDQVIAVEREGLTIVRRLAAQGYRRQRAALAEGLERTVADHIRWAEENRHLFV